MPYYSIVWKIISGNFSPYKRYREKGISKGFQRVFILTSRRSALISPVVQREKSRIRGVVRPFPDNYVDRFQGLET